MPSTYSSLLRLELMATGEKSATWGDITNTNLGTLLEKSIAGTATINVTAGNVTMTALNGADDEARCTIINVTGTPGVSRNVVAPSASKTYCVINGSNAAIVFKGAATTGVTLSAGQRAWLAWNGLDFVVIGVLPDSPSFTGTSSFVNLAVSGVASLAAGSAGAPSLSFTGDLNNGWWSPAADTQAWSIAGAELMRLQSVGLGVGMTPTYRLDVTGGAGNGIRYVGPTAQVLMGESGSLGAVGTITNHALTFLANNSVVGRFSAAGNFGIGVDPSYVLDAKASSDPAGVPSVRFGGNNRPLFFQPGTGSAFIYGPVLGFGAYVNTSAGNYIQPSGIGMTGGAAIAGPYGGGLEFYAYNAGVETGTTQTLASTLRMKLDGTGNLGVGISPSTRLHLGGASTVEARIQSTGSLTTGAGAAFVRFAGSDTTGPYIGFGGSAAALDIYNSLSGPINIYTATTLRMAVGSGGNVTINAPSSGYPLQADANGTVAALFRNTNGGSVNAGIAFGSPGSSNLSAGVAGLAISSTSGELLLQYVTGSALTEGLRLTVAGQLRAPAIHNNGSGAAGTTPMIASGTYTPTFTNVAGTTANTPRTCQWLRVGNVCHVSGNIDVTCSSGAGVSWRLSLPIASNLANSWELGGTAARSGAPQFGGILILGDSTNNEATFSFTNDTNTLSLLYSFSFSYVVL